MLSGKRTGIDTKPLLATIRPQNRESTVGLFGIGAGLFVVSAVIVWACRARDGRVVPFLDGRMQLQTYLGMATTVGFCGGILMMLLSLR